MKRYLKLYLTQWQYGLISNMIYRTNFIMLFIVDLAWGTISLIFFTALYQNLTLLGGWTYPQMLLLLGCYRFFNAAFWGLLWPNMQHIPRMINRGELDLWITKPVDSQFLISTRHISLNMISSVMMGSGLIYYSSRFLQIDLGLLKIASLLSLLVAGVVISYALWFITVTTVFYFGRLNNMVNLFPEIFSIAQFPKTAFPVIMQAIITFVIPVGIIAYTPAQIIMGRAQWWEIGLPIVLAVVFLYLSHCFWNFALKSYTSASS